MDRSLPVGIIGSGPSAIAVAKRLVSMGVSATIIDVGEELEKSTQYNVEILSRSDPALWDRDILEQLTSNKSLKDSRIPRKMLFGSDYFYANKNFSEVINSPNMLASSSLAKGGFSVAWGAAMLPVNQKDMDNWPINRNELDDSFDFILKNIPYSACDDDLSKEFPLYCSERSNLKIPLLAKHFLSKSKRVNKKLGSGELILSGQARLAVRVGEYENGCRYCGQCLSGCVYGSIYSTKQDLELLINTNKVTYISGLHVVKVDEVNSIVEILAQDIKDSSFIKMQFKKLFIGAGALNSTKIVMESLGHYNQKVQFKDSQKFLLPILSLRSFPIEWPELNSFSSVYLESFLPEISSRWIHMQVSPINDLFLKKVGITSIDSWKMQIAKPFLKRMLFGWCGLHSDYSSGFDAELTLPYGAEHSRLVLSEKVNLETSKKAVDFSRNMAIKFLKEGIIFSPFPFMSKIGGGNHIGSSLPMSKFNENFYSTDTLGRHSKWSSIHIVDSSILPSIPGTTIALLTMANADRIAKNAFYS